MKNNLLIVYNTCGVRSENIDYCIGAIDSILDQNFEGYKVVVSMFKNTLKFRRALATKFGNKISYIFYDEGKIGVNATFNKTVRACVERFGNFDGYLYLDSGVTFGPHQTTFHPHHGQAFYNRNRDVLRKIYETFKSGPYAMAAIQVDWDAGFSQIGLAYDSGPPAQIQDEDLIVPIGKAINLHSQIFSHELYDALDGKLLPDIFAAFCSESVLSFFNAAIHKKWVIMKDIIIHHYAAMEGHQSASASFAHNSSVHGNSWNNLLFGRNALDFINDPEAIAAGLGYEECNQIMLHKPDMFDEDGYAKEPEKLLKMIKKHLFASQEEFDYDKIQYRAIYS